MQFCFGGLRMQGPFTPEQRCKCRYPEKVAGLNWRYCWGETVCKKCGRHLHWGVM